MHRRILGGAVILRSSAVATIIALLFMFLFGLPPGAPEQAPPTHPPDVAQEDFPGSSTEPPAGGSSTGSASKPSTETSIGSGSSAGSNSGSNSASNAGSNAGSNPGSNSDSASGSESGSASGPVVPSAAPLAGRTVVLDAGHGGVDPGATGVSGRTREKYNTLFVALDAKAMLEQAGANVIMTRSDDRFVPLATRAAIANQAGADIFISIHNDSNPNPSIRGVSTYYYHDRSRRLADVMQAKMASKLGARNIGVFRRSFQVVRETVMPSVLLELGFLSNWNDEQLLADPAYRYRAAQAIYDGVVQYFNGA